MKTFSNLLGVGVLLLGVAVGWYEHGVVATNRARIATLREQLATETTRSATLAQERDSAVRQLRTAQASADESGNGTGRNDAAAAADPVAQKLDRMVADLKAKLKNAPEHHIPELALLTEDDWYQIAVSRLDGSYDNARGLRIGFAELRRAAKGKITMPLWSALQGYVRAHDGMLPAKVEDLAPHLKVPLDPAILRRYEVVAQGRYADLPLQKAVIEESAAVDPEFDFLVQIRRTRDGTISASVDLHLQRAKVEITRALEAYRAANAGAPPADPAQLASYFSRPVDSDELQRNWRRLGFGAQ